MTYHVKRITDELQLEALPVAKITRYPLEERDYKPYSQGIACVTEDKLILRMWAFEVAPSPASHLRCVLYLFRDVPERALCVDVFPAGLAQARWMINGELREGTAPPAGFAVQELGGEDLQGVYWGALVRIPLDALGEGTLLPVPGGEFPGNFYKLCDEDPLRHSGSCFPADFKGNPYAADQMGVFVAGESL